MKKLPFTTSELMIHLIDCWRRFLKIPGPKEELQTREFRSVCTALTKPTDSRESLAASLLYHFPLHLYEGLSLLQELPQRPKRVLDVGAGLGSFSLASLIMHGSSVVALDKNESALLLGADVIGRLGYAFTPFPWAYSPSKNLPHFDDQFDCIILGHALHELCPTLQDKRSLIQKLVACLSPQGYILIVDGTEMDTMQWLYPLRKEILGMGLPILAPCISQCACPAEDAKTYCFAQRSFDFPYLMKELQRGMNLFLRSLKMSYLLIAKTPLTKEIPDNMFRVISAPIDVRGRDRYFLCGKSGQKCSMDIAGSSSFKPSRGSIISYSAEEAPQLIQKEYLPITEVIWKKK